MTQTIQFVAASSQSTLAAKLYATGATNPAAVVATASTIVEAAKGIYVATFTGVAPDTYVLEITDYTTEGVAVWMVGITAGSGHFLSYEFGGSPSSGGGGDCDPDEIAQAVAAQLGGSGSAAASTPDAGNVVGFPSSLTIGDAYLETNGRHIDLYLTDGAGNHRTTYGSKALADATAEVRLARGSRSAELVGTVGWNNPGGEVDPYFRVELPASETAKAVPDHEYTWQLILNWDSNTTHETTPVCSGKVAFCRKVLQ